MYESSTVTEPPVARSGSAVQLRDARPDHVAAMARIWERGWVDGHLGHVPDGLAEHRTTAEFVRRSRARVGETTVAAVPDRADAVVGFVVVRGDEVEQLYVDAAWRGTSVASALIGHAESQIAAAHDVAWLAVVAGNVRARRFYERCGWCDAGHHDNPAEVSEGGVMLVPTRRYEKAVRATAEVR